VPPGDWVGIERNPRTAVTRTQASDCRESEHNPVTARASTPIDERGPGRWALPADVRITSVTAPMDLSPGALRGIFIWLGSQVHV